MKKQITLVLVAVALFICNLGISAQELPTIQTIEAAGRGIWTNSGFGLFGDMCAPESEGVFTWVGALRYNGGNGNPGGNGFKWYVNGYIDGGSSGDNYQIFAPAQDTEVEDGGVYPAGGYALKTTGAYQDLKWRLKNGEDGYYKITLNVSDPTAITMSLKKVDATYANLGLLRVEGLVLVQTADEAEGFDPDVYVYNCYIPANAISTEVSYFAYRNQKVAFNGVSTAGSILSSSSKSTGVPFTTDPITVSDGDVSTVAVTGFDNLSTQTYTINYILDVVNGVNSNAASKAACTVKGQVLTVSGADAYVVYAVSGTVVADVRTNAPGKTVSLLPGVYVVKTNTAETFKVVIK